MKKNRGNRRGETIVEFTERVLREEEGTAISEGGLVVPAEAMRSRQREKATELLKERVWGGRCLH